MATINRVRVVWAGIPGGTGISTMYFDSSGAPNIAGLRTAFANLANVLPTGVTIQVPNHGDSLDDSSGALNGVWNTTPATVITGTGGTTFAGASGGVVNWKADAIVNGRRLAGKTFVVPLATAAYAAGGVLSTLANTSLNNFAGAVVAISGPRPVVWHRPNAGGGGRSAPMNDGIVPNLAAVLRSRRT